MIILAFVPQDKSPTIEHLGQSYELLIVLAVAGIIFVGYLIWETVRDVRHQRDVERTRKKKHG